MRATGHGLPSSLVIAGVGLRRMLRDRTAMFFIVLLPVLVILIIGATVGGYSSFRVGLVVLDGGALSGDLVQELRAADSVEVASYADAAAARRAVRRGELAAAVVVPAGFDATLAAGRNADVTVVTGSDPGTRQAVTAVLSAVVDRQAARVQAAAFAADQVGGGVRDHLGTATRLQAGAPVAAVRTDVVDGAGEILPEGFGYSAPTMLVLFVFINAFAGGAALIETRTLGIHARALAAPVRPRSIVLGEALCYVGLGLFQSALIVLIGSALFGVSWGDPVAAATLIVVWALVGAGAGMLSGTLFRTADQAGAIGSAIGIGLAMLGGCMWPLALVAPAMRAIGHLSPHAWAVDAWTALLSRNGDLGDIALQVLILSAVAAGLLSLAAVRMRRRLLD